MGRSNRSEVPQGWDGEREHSGGGGGVRIPVAVFLLLVSFMIALAYFAVREVGSAAKPIIIGVFSGLLGVLPLSLFMGKLIANAARTRDRMMSYDNSAFDRNPYPPPGALPQPIVISMPQQGQPERSLVQQRPLATQSYSSPGSSYDAEPGMSDFADWRIL